MSLPAQDAEPLVNEVFARFWRRMTPELFQERFRHLGSVLAYLRVCARNLAINHVRRQERERQIAALLENVTVDLPESTAIRNVNVQELAACVRDCLSDDAERLVVFLSFEQGLKPREIHARYPDRFASPHEVSRIKERVLERLRHNLRLRGFWDAL
jgi:RNA polymerase sigma factor (sigma-70 family)